MLNVTLNSRIYFMRNLVLLLLAPLHSSSSSSSTTSAPAFLRLVLFAGADKAARPQIKVLYSYASCCLHRVFLVITTQLSSYLRIHSTDFHYSGLFTVGRHHLRFSTIVAFFPTPPPPPNCPNPPPPPINYQQNLLYSAVSS